MFLSRHSDRTRAPAISCAMPIARERSSLWCVGMMFVLLSTGAWPLSAQEEAPVSTSKPADATENEPKRDASALPELPAEIEYLKGPDGKLVPVRRDATMEKFLEFIERERTPPEAAPLPAVARLEISGRADDEWALLRARVVIHQPQAKGYAPLALGLHEAVLRDWKHEGPGDMYLRRDRSQGQVWWIQGQGEHVLTLEFSAPVKKQAPNRRLQLTLPEATVSLLQLTTKFREIKLTKEIEGTSLQIAADAGGSARIEAFGLGTRLDLNWQPVETEPSTAPLVEAETTILVQPEGDKLRLDASQRLHVLQGALAEAIVRLPANSELISVDGRDYREHRVDPEDPSKVTVQLASPDGNHFLLTWSVLLSADELRRFVVEGFQVEPARRQRGRIGLVQTESLRMRVSQVNQPHVVQIDARELRPSTVSQAYRFSSQPFRLVVEVKAEEPYFVVEPRIALSVSAQELNLEGTFPIHVFRGNLTSVDLSWPNWKIDDWKLQSVEPLQSLESDFQGQAGYLRLHLQEDHPDQFVIRLKARRPLRSGESVVLSLPQLNTPDAMRTELHISDAENIHSEVIALGETRLEQQLEPAMAGPKEAGGEELQHQRIYQVLPGEQTVSLTANRQEQLVDLTTELSLERSGNQLSATQSFLFNVQHERMSQVQIVIPEVWRQRSLNFRMNGDRPQVDWLPGARGESATVRVTLPEPKLGRFKLQVSYELPLPDEALSGAATIKAPLFTCVGHVARQAEVQVDPADWLEMTVADSGWAVRPDLTGKRRWATEEGVNSVDINLNPGGGGAKQFLISEAAVSTDWDRSGMAQCRAAYRLSGWFVKINVILPPECQSPRFFWDGEAVSEERDVDQALPGKPRHLTIRVPAPRTENEVHEFVSRYDSTAKQLFGISNGWTMTAPQLPQGVWLSPRVWRVSFPPEQHLFSYPATVSPLFSWKRTGLFWSRVTDPDYRSGLPGFEMPSAIDDAPSPEAAAGTVYAFRLPGDVQEWRISTMSRSLVMLIGASVALGAGFLLMNFVWARHVLTLWCAAFLVALAGLWFQPQLELLLQAVVIGFLFPLLAVGIQNLRRRHRPIAILSYDPLLDGSESRSSQSGSLLLSPEAGSEPTVLRAPSGSTRDFLRAEAGSGVS